MRFKTPPPSNCCAVIVTDKTMERRRGRCRFPQKERERELFVPTTVLKINASTWLRECYRQVEAEVVIIGTNLTKPHTRIIFGPSASLSQILSPFCVVSSNVPHFVRSLSNLKRRRRREERGNLVERGRTVC